MANYDRRILVPYLRDVCSMEMLCSQLSREIEECDEEINYINKYMSQELLSERKPEKGDYEPDHSESKIMIVFMLVIPIAIGLFIWGCGASFGWFFASLVFAGVMGTPWISTIRIENYNAEVDYKEALEKYEYRITKNNETRRKKEEMKVNLQEWINYKNTVQRRLDAAINMRQKLYGINVIPSRYRNIHVSYYLYDFFNTSRETDLEKVIQTMLLDEIIKRLDKIIVQNEKIILNQRIQLAVQESTHRMIAENHRDEMKKIARLERNQELQMDYQRMIAKNQEVTNFFLAAEYLRNN